MARLFWVVEIKARIFCVEILMREIKNANKCNLGEQNRFVVKNFESGSARAAVAIFCAASFEFIGVGGEIFLRVAENFLSAVGVRENN